MVPFIIFVAGVAVGIGACKLYDVLKNSPDSAETRHFNSPHINTYGSIMQPTGRRTNNTSNLDITPLVPIMRRYSVDITAPNCLYILCNQIKSSTYKSLLDDIIENTKTGEDLISYINNVNIESFTYPNTESSKDSYFIPVTTIDQLLTASAIVADFSDPKTKVETLINSAYTSAIDRLKKNFGIEFGKLIKAYEEGRELQSYYNDIIKEIKISRDFMTVKK